MSLLAEIATRADVPLEAVMRVLTREPVSEDAKARILAVLDELDAEQTRVLQRFALAAVHDVLPRPAAAAVEAEVIDPDPEPAALEAPQAALPAAAAESAPLAQLGPVLAELADAVRELRRETDAERRERVDDLAVLIDLITKGWEGLDRRLGRLERQLARLEGAEPRRVLPVAIEPPPVPSPPPPEPAPPPPPPDGDGRTVLRGRLPLVAVLALGVGVGAVAALDLPERADVSSVVASANGETAARRPPSRPPTAGSVLGEVATDLTTAPATTAPRTAAPPPATTARTTAPPSSSAAATTAATTERATGFRPSRKWAWPPAAGADYYLVEFFREGRLLYRATPTAAQVTLPDSVVFTRGSYRWRVRPGRGERSDNDLQPPIVDSAFTVG